jgi:Ice-binding-like
MAGTEKDAKAERNPLNTLTLRRQTMKDLMVRTRTFTVLTSRLVVMALFAALLAAVPFHAALAATAPDLGLASSFAVLGSSTVTCTGGSFITGDVGVSPGSAVTGFPVPCTVSGTIHAADTLAFQAHHDAALAYAALVAETCTTNLTGQVLGTDVGTLAEPLLPGVYCFDSSAQLTGTLYLTGGGPWIFQIGSTLTTASNASVLINGNPTNAENCLPGAFWAVGSSATLGTGTQFQGIILALISDTLNTGANVSGGVFALTGAVTLNTNRVNACSFGGATPAAGTIKVTGGGQIPVPNPDSNVSSDTGLGRATFGFNAQSDKSGGAKGHFNYVNHVNGLHVDGPVNDIAVIAFNLDGSPKTVLFSGTCGDGCSFSVTVEDHGEPGTSDQFGITVSGGLSEVRSQRVISNGNIQFHK